jgi:hypothetical protein
MREKTRRYLWTGLTLTAAICILTECVDNRSKNRSQAQVPARVELRLLHPQHDAEMKKLFTPDQLTSLSKYIAEHGRLPKPLPLNPGAALPNGYALMPGRSLKGKGIVTYAPYLVTATAGVPPQRPEKAWVAEHPLYRDKWDINFRLDPKGAGIMQAVTRANIGSRIGFVADGYVFGAPTIRNGIPGVGMLGPFTKEEAEWMADRLQADDIRSTVAKTR